MDFSGKLDVTRFLFELESAERRSFRTVGENEHGRLLGGTWVELVPKM